MNCLVQDNAYMLALCVSITVMNIFNLISFIAYFFGDIAVLQESVRHEIYLHLMLLNLLLMFSV